MIGFLSSIKGGQRSKTKTNVFSVGSASSAYLPTKPIRMDVGSIYSADLSSYKRACELDLDLKSVGTTIHERTNRVINSLAAGPEYRALSIDYLVDVTECLLEMNEEVMKFMIESKEDVLRKFKAAGGPFRDDFIVQIEFVYEQQVVLLEELHKQKTQIDRKLKKLKSWKKVSNKVFDISIRATLQLFAGIKEGLMFLGFQTENRLRKK